MIVIKQDKWTKEKEFLFYEIKNIVVAAVASGISHPFERFFFFIFIKCHEAIVNDSYYSILSEPFFINKYFENRNQEQM